MTDISKRYKKVFGEEMYYSREIPRIILKNLEYYNDVTENFKIKLFTLEKNHGLNTESKKNNSITINKKEYRA